MGVGHKDLMRMTLILIKFTAEAWDRSLTAKPIRCPACMQRVRCEIFATANALIWFHLYIPWDALNLPIISPKSKHSRIEDLELKVPCDTDVLLMGVSALTVFRGELNLPKLLCSNPLKSSCALTKEMDFSMRPVRPFLP